MTYSQLSKFLSYYSYGLKKVWLYLLLLIYGELCSTSIALKLPWHDSNVARRLSLWSPVSRFRNARLGLESDALWYYIFNSQYLYNLAVALIRNIFERRWSQIQEEVLIVGNVMSRQTAESMTSNILSIPTKRNFRRLLISELGILFNFSKWSFTVDWVTTEYLVQLLNLPLFFIASILCTLLYSDSETQRWNWKKDQQLSGIIFSILNIFTTVIALIMEHYWSRWS